MVRLGKMVYITSLILAVPSPALWAGNACVTCHQKPETISALPAWYQNQFLHWYGSVHGKKGVSCDRCHGGEPDRAEKKDAHEGVKPVSDPQSPVYYKNLPETCGSCHRGVYRQFIQSRHYKNLKDERLAPTCTTCHGFQMDIGDVVVSQIAGRCTICHNPETGAKPEVGAQTRQALDGVANAGHAIERAGFAIELAREQGVETGRLEKNIDAQRQRLRATAELWHRFDLKAFTKKLAGIQTQAEEISRHASESMTKKK